MLGLSLSHIGTLKFELQKAHFDVDPGDGVPLFSANATITSQYTGTILVSEK